MKKVFAILMALVLTFSCFGVIASAEPIPEKPADDPIVPELSQIASVVFNNFYFTTTSATVTLAQTCYYLSVNVTCASGTDSMMIGVEDVTHSGTYSSTLPFTADGSTTTFGTYLQPGVYRVYLTGSNILHSMGIVVFST